MVIYELKCHIHVSLNYMIVIFRYGDIFRINLCERRRQHPTYSESRVETNTCFGYRTSSLMSNFQEFVKEDLVAIRRFKFQHQVSWVFSQWDAGTHVYVSIRKVFLILVTTPSRENFPETPPYPQHTPSV